MKPTGVPKTFPSIAIWRSRAYRFHLPEATMTWEPDTIADLEEKLACRCCGIVFVSSLLSPKESCTSKATG